MPKVWYSYKFGKSVPLLTADEWQQVYAQNPNPIETLKRYCAETGKTLRDAQQAIASREIEFPALDTYERITGVRLSNPEELYATPMETYGPPCPECDKPFRTPRARFCAECGYELLHGQRAESLGRLEDYS